MGEVEIVGREEYTGLELDAKVERIRGLIPLGLMHVQEFLDDEVKSLAGRRYAHDESSGSRHGTNPGTLRLAGQRVTIRAPRVRSEKRFLGFVETDTENEKVLTPFLRSLIDRGLDVSQGLLVVIDGGKGLRAAVNQVLKQRVVIQRCVWHKRENVVSYLPKTEHASWRSRLQRAYDRPTYAEAKAALMKLYRELAQRNQSAAASLAEGMEETLALHRLGLYEILGKSFKTTNCLESVNSLVEERCAEVDSWKNSNHRRRWLATALLDIEPRLRRVKGHQQLSTLQAALRRKLNIKNDVVRGRSAA